MIKLCTRIMAVLCCLLVFTGAPTVVTAAEDDAAARYWPQWRGPLSCGVGPLADSLRVAAILAGYAAAIWAYSMTHVLTRAFYAVKDAKTPLKISLKMVALNLVLNLILIWPLGAAGLAWSTAISAVVQVVLLLRATGRFVHQPVDREVWQGWLRSAVLTTGMGAVLVPLLLMFNLQDLSQRDSIVLLAVLVTLGAAVFLGGAALWRCDELTWLRRRRV